MAHWLTGEHWRAEQVISWITVVEDHAAECKVTVLNLTFPNRIGRDAWICAVYHWMKKKRKKYSYANMNYSISLIIMGEYRQQNTDSGPINFYCCKDISGKTNVFNANYCWSCTVKWLLVELKVEKRPYPALLLPWVQSCLCLFMYWPTYPHAFILHNTQYLTLQYCNDNLMGSCTSFHCGLQW